MRLARLYGEPELERRAAQVVAAVNTLLARAPQCKVMVDPWG